MVWWGKTEFEQEVREREECCLHPDPCLHTVPYCNPPTEPPKPYKPTDNDHKKYKEAYEQYKDFFSSHEIENCLRADDPVNSRVRWLSGSTFFELSMAAYLYVTYMEKHNA